MRFAPPERDPYVVEAVDLYGLFESNAVALRPEVGRLREGRDSQGLDDMKWVLEFNDHPTSTYSYGGRFSYVVWLSDGRQVVATYWGLMRYLKHCGQSPLREPDHEQHD